jgi:3-oxoacyl-[acyl-carrier protein] reductase
MIFTCSIKLPQQYLGSGYMDLKLTGRVVAITGGSTGIGAETALAFAREGCQVAVCGRSKKKLYNLETRFAQEGLKVFTVCANVLYIEQLTAFLEQTVRKFGQLDILVNNAAIDKEKPFAELSEDEWNEIVNIDFKAVYYGCVFAARQMRKQCSGVIINISSFASVLPVAGSALYSSIKSAVDQLTRTLSAELAAYNIRIVSIQPGVTETQLTAHKRCVKYEELINAIPMRRFAHPAELASVIVFAASDCAGYINGVPLQVSGAKFAVQNPQYSYIHSIK